MSISIEEVGSFIDKQAGKNRDSKTIAKRLLEETVELCRAAGIESGDIFMTVTDALHNQALKSSYTKDETIFPSIDGKGISGDLTDEVADVSIVLKDLIWISKINIDEAEESKWNRFIKKDYRISNEGAIYSKKRYIKDVPVLTDEYISNAKNTLSELETILSASSDFSQIYIEQCEKELSSIKKVLDENNVNYP